MRAPRLYVLDLAEPPVERQDHELALAPEPVDDQAIGILRVADHHDGDLVTRQTQLAAIKKLVGGYKADLLSLKCEIRQALGGLDALAYLRLHVESHLQSRSADHAAPDPAPDFGDGEEGIVPGSNSRKDHADRFARAGGPRKSRFRHRGGA